MFVFLVCAEATVPVGEKSVASSFKTPRAASQVKFIRGGEVVGYVGEDGKLIPSNAQSGELLSKNMHGTRRTVRIALDASQYALDVAERRNRATVHGLTNPLTLSCAVTPRKTTSRLSWSVCETL